MPDTFKFLSFPDDFYKIFCFENYPLSILEEEAENKNQARYLLKYLKYLNCKSVLVENEYVDRDFIEDYTSYYAKCFSSYKRFCKRAHFWNEDISHLDLKGIILNKDKTKIEHLKASYLGFVVIKPLPDAVVGRTVLKKTQNGDRQKKIKATQKYSANLFGIELIVDSLAFQEQDTVLAACATTALWSSFQITSNMFHTASLTPSEITSSANKYIQTTRPIPSHSLNIEQICYAISENSLAPEIQEVTVDIPLNSLIYSYLCAKIPVVLGYELNKKELYHAVTICGYKLEDKICSKPEVKNPLLDINLIGKRISEFYCHDDNLGPFSTLKCSENGSINPRFFKRGINGEAYREDKCYPIVVIVPVYHKIRLRFCDILGGIRNMSNYLNAVGANYFDKNNPDGIEWEIRLCDLTELKAKVIESDTILNEDKERLLFSNFQRYNWIGSALIDGKRIFSLISDATDIERSFHFRQCIFHDQQNKQEIAEMIRTSDPYFGKALAAGLPRKFIDFIADTFLLKTS